MPQISTRAAAARENARHSDGTFGTYQLDDAGTDADLDMSFLDADSAFGDFGDEVEPGATPEPEQVKPAPRRRRGSRTDIHAPGSPDFDPEAYSDPDMFFYVGNDEERAMGTYDARSAAMTMQGMREDGWKLGHGGPTQCGHCGSHMTYSALIRRPEEREYIFVGEDCLKGTFGRTAGEFAELREQHALAVKNQARKARIRALIEGDPQAYDEFFRQPHPLLADLTYPQLIADLDYYSMRTSDFLESISTKMMREGCLSQRQIEAAEAALTRGIQHSVENQAKAERKAALIASGVSVPTGKTRIEGTVTTTKVVESQYGSTLKMRVESPEGWAVWGTVPRQLSDADPRGLVGATIAFDATIEASREDKLFGFYSRPTKSQLVTPAPRESADEMYARVMLDVEAHQEQAEQAMAHLERLLPTEIRRPGDTAVRTARLATTSRITGLDLSVRGEVFAQLDVIDAAESKITAIEEDFLNNQHHYVSREFSEAKMRLSRAQQSIPNQESYIADQEAGLTNTTDPKTIAKVKRALNTARRDLQATKENLPQFEAQVQAAAEDFERSKARVKFFRGLLARYRDGRGEPLTAPQ